MKSNVETLIQQLWHQQIDYNLPASITRKNSSSYLNNWKNLNPFGGLIARSTLADVITLLLEQIAQLSLDRTDWTNHIDEQSQD